MGVTYKKQNRRIEVRNHMIVTNFDKKLFQYASHNVFKEKSLINKKTSVFSSYWDNNSGLLATAEEKTIIDFLAKTEEETQIKEKKSNCDYYILRMWKLYCGLQII